jgi:uncharacterized protein (DUF1015 family)
MFFDTARVGSLDNIVTQPYDKIDAALQAEYYERSPYNLVRIIRGREEEGDGPDSNVYTRAAAFEQQWLAEGILKEHDEPGYYVYHQEYTLPGGQTRTRKGFIALVESEPPGKRYVHPHERTHHGPKEDRLKLLQATYTHWGQIFMLYSDPKQRVEQEFSPFIDRAPDFQATDHFGDVHRVWYVSDPKAVSRISRELKRKDFFIADGHHRYETSVAFSEQNAGIRSEFVGEQSPEYTMVSLVNMDGEGLSIFATHRLLYDLDDFSVEPFLEKMETHFDVRTYPWSSDLGRDRAFNELEEDLRLEGLDRPVFGATFKGHDAAYLFLVRDLAALVKEIPGDQSAGWKSLDVNILHSVILDRYIGVTAEDTANERKVHYERWLSDGTAKVADADSTFQAGFFMNPVRMEQITSLVKRGERFPEKSTDFYPKMLAGLVMDRMQRKGS